MATMAPSSPRLPSPPPPAEIQLGPKSPSIGGISAGRQAQAMEQTVLDANSKRRIHAGTKNADFAAGPPLVPLNELDSPFQLQEHLAALHYHHTSLNTTPLTRPTAALLATPPPGIDANLWLYELCRFLIMQCNSLLVGFLFDTPPCSAATCPEMRASEWQFLCAVHEQPKSCCAIDYCCHTLDWAANVVTNPQIFPSRFVMAGEGEIGGGVQGGVHGAAVKNLTNVFRRLHRIFAHAWFQHKGVFWSVEGQTGLYVFFKTVCDQYDLLPAENYKLPPEAEGLDSVHGEESEGAVAADRRASVVPVIASRPKKGDDDDHLAPVPSIGRTNTRRHIRSSPSTGAAVMTVMEQNEEEEDEGHARGAPAEHIASRMKEMHISAPQADIEEEEEGASEAVDVPVIVEQDAEAESEGDQTDVGEDTTILLDTEESAQEPSAATVPAVEVAVAEEPAVKEAAPAPPVEKAEDDETKDVPAIKLDEPAAAVEPESKERAKTASPKPEKSAAPSKIPKAKKSAVEAKDRAKSPSPEASKESEKKPDAKANDIETADKKDDEKGAKEDSTAAKDKEA